VAKQKLDLFEFAATLVAEAGTTQLSMGHLIATAFGIILCADIP